MSKEPGGLGPGRLPFYRWDPAWPPKTPKNQKQMRGEDPRPAEVSQGSLAGRNAKPAPTTNHLNDDADEDVRD